MDASQLWYPVILHSSPKHEFFFFYPPWVCEMLWNTSKQHFGSNGLEWMLHNFGTPKYFWTKTQVLHLFMCWSLAKCSETLPNIILGPMDKNGCFTTLVPRNIAFGPETRVFLLLPAEGLRNALKHFHTSFWVQWTRMDASQLWYPKIVHPGSNRSFASCSCRRLVNHLKHSQTSFWVQWTRMDASQLWYPEIVHSGPKYEFCIFYVPKVSEMLWNTPKHHFGPMD
jgi:hypothetical protein